MNRKLQWIFYLLILLLGTLASWAAEEMDIIAPGGAEVDLTANVMKYYSSDTKLVEVRWDTFFLETKYLEYDRNQMVLTGRELVKVTQQSPVQRVLKAQEVKFNQNLNFLSASKDVFLQYDNNTTITGNLLEWDQKTEEMTMSEKAVVNYKDWILKGSKIEGDFKKQLFIALGPVEAFDKSNLIRGGRLIFDRNIEKVFVQDNPVLIRGNNEMTAKEIIYDLRTSQVSANGVVKTKVINNSK